jgi:hypothetical protein
LIYELTNRFLWVFKSTGKKQTDASTITEESEFDLESENFILCRNCGNKITSPELIIAVHGMHKHTFTNPAGIAYQIGCFSDADGCMIYGDPTRDYTWFKGFSWSLGLCSNCFTHLGWFYKSEDKSFFGLILDRLKDTTKTH